MTINPNCDCGACCNTCCHSDDCLSIIFTEQSDDDRYDHDAYTL